VSRNGCGGQHSRHDSEQKAPQRAARAPEGGLRGEGLAPGGHGAPETLLIDAPRTRPGAFARPRGGVRSDMAFSPGSLAEAALATAARLRDAADITRAQADLMRRRAAATRAIAVSERVEGEMTPSPIHAGPRHFHADLLDQEAEVHDT